MARSRFTHVVHSSALTALRRVVLHDARDRLLLVVALVEEIHDHETYAAYATANSGLLAPYLAADNLSIVSRAMTRDLPQFRELYCTDSVGAAPVERIPLMVGRGAGLARWLSSETYQSENAPRRFASSGHGDVHVLALEAGGEEERAAEAVVASSGEAHSSSAAPFVVLQTFLRGSADGGLHEALAEHGAKTLISRNSAEEESGGCHLTLEGTPVERLDIVRLPTWSDVEALSVQSLPSAIKAFERGGGVGRILSFSPL
jgi:hypothetical protein